MNLSYWELKSWLSNVDFTIVGSGIVGLTCALQLRARYPESNILLLEKGILPQGASTKNAGFACFGSLSELIDDLQHHTEEQVLHLVRQRIEGLRVLRSALGDRAIDYQQLGGYELFLNKDEQLLETCMHQLDAINSLLHPIYSEPVFEWKEKSFGFQNINQKFSFNKFEGQIDTGKMMYNLMNSVLKQDIKVLNATTVEQLVDAGNKVHVKTNHFDFFSSKVFIATNGFASQLLKEDVKPARAQVLITKPIKDLEIKGTFHLDRGFYYFRNIDNRILIGGGRNLDVDGETTTDFALSDPIQDRLEQLLKTTVLPGISFDIAHRWTGIMGVGSSKNPVVKQVGNNIYCGVRLGGMGVAIGSSIGKRLAQLY